MPFFQSLTKYLTWQQIGIASVLLSALLLSPYIQAMEQEGKYSFSAFCESWRNPIITIKRLDVNTVKLLLKVGVNIRDARDERGRTALSVALNAASPDNVHASSRQLEIISLLLQKRPFNECNSHWTPYLIEAVKPRDVRPNIDIIKILINKGFSVNCVDSDGYTPLSIALRYESTSIAELLLKNGADVKLGSLTPLTVAARQGHTNFIQLLLEYNVDINRADTDMKSPLLEAASVDQINSVRLLLLSGARPDPISSLRYSVASLKIKQLLIAYGAEASEDSKGDTFRGKSFQNILNRSAFEGDTETIEVALACEALAQLDCEHPLIIASACGHKKAVMTLVEFLDERNRLKREILRDTLQCAAVNGRLAVVECLLENKKIERLISLTPKEAKSILLSVGARWDIDIRTVLEANLPIVVFFGKMSNSSILASESLRRPAIVPELQRIIHLLSPYTVEPNIQAISERLRISEPSDSSNHVSLKDLAMLMMLERH